MGIRNIVNSERDRYDPSHEPPLTLTEAAAEEVRTRLAGYEGERAWPSSYSPSPPRSASAWEWASSP